MLYQKNKNSTKIFVICVFVSLIVSSNILLISSLSPIKGKGDNSLYEDSINLDTSALFDLSDYFITGTGNSLETRTYAENLSYSNNNLGYFNIAAPTTPMRLSYGEFNFTFQNNYTTEYVLEEDNALYPSEHFDNYKANFQDSDFTINDGTIETGTADEIKDNNQDSYMRFISSGTSLDFTIKNDFTGAAYRRVAFDRSNILGLIVNYTYSINQTVSLTLHMKNASDDSWNIILDSFSLNASTGIDSFNEIFINTNLNFINSTDISEIRFDFTSSSDPFKLELREFSLNSTMGFELPISSQEYVALEFDLRGESTQVNGFYAWIRTLNLTDAIGKTLNISLYEASGTIVRSDGSLLSSTIKPNNSMLIDTKLFSYQGDDITYFDFNIGNTYNLTFNNYFIVIKSDASEGTYSLVTIPGAPYGDEDKIDHQLKRTIDDGSTWNRAQITQGSYTTPWIDASSFKLNVTRGYIPSDFNDTLQMENIYINDKAMSFYPFSGNANEYGNAEWGKGACNDTFLPHIDDVASNFQLDLTWNSNITNGFEFNVTYHVVAYAVGSTTTTYEVKYDGIPKWSLNFTLNTNIANWNYTEFWYVYPNDMDAHNLKDPNYNEILMNSTSNELPNPENIIYDIVIVDSNVNGEYSLNLTSTNYLSTSQQVHSYINYNSTLWETKGFMYGDNISISLDVKDHNNQAPTSGDANVSLFIDGTYDTSLTSDIGNVSEDNKYLIYYFGNQSILDVDSSVLFNKYYYLGYFWTNGTAIGCKKSQIFIDNYVLDYSKFEYDEDVKGNLLYIKHLNKNYKYWEDYNLLVATVNQTTSKPSYPISKINLNRQYSYTNPLIPVQLDLVLNSFKQSEDILNPDETIDFKVELENLELSYNLKLRIKVQLVSLVNEEWIIAEGYSTTQILDSSNSGTGDHKKEFDVTLTVPSYESMNQEWYGKNAPIRKGGAKTIVTIYYVDQDEIFGVYESDDYSILIDDNENNFEGYIIGLTHRVSSTTDPLVNISRNDCLYNQTGYNTTIIVNYYTKYYASIYDDYIANFSLKMHSLFDNIATIPSDIDDVDEFNLTSVLKTEFGEILSGKTVTCQYQNETGGWTNLDNPIDTTDQNGKTEFEIILKDLVNISESFKIRLMWSGNETINGTIQEELIIRNPSTASLTILLGSLPTVYKRILNQVIIRFSNTGNKVLSIFKDNITISIKEFGNDISIDIFYKSALQNLAPGEAVDITIQFFLPSIDSETIYLNITINTEDITQKTTIISLTAINPTYLSNISLIIILLAIAGIFLLWLGAVLYSRRVKYNIRQSLKEPVKKERPRRGRYVKPSELKPITKIKELEQPKLEKEPKVVEKIVEEEKPTTDLDSLLAETGIDTTVKKPQYSRSALKKWNLDKLRDYCKKNGIKFSSKTTKSELIDKILSKNKK